VYKRQDKSSVRPKHRKKKGDERVIIDVEGAFSGAE